MEKRLEEMNRMAALGEIVSHLTSELRPPISSILVCAEIIRAESRDESIRKYAEILHAEAVKVSNMTGLLSDCMVRGEKRSPVVEINNLVDQTVSLFKYQLKSKGIGLQVHLYKGTLFIRGDRYRIQQAFFNILLNAFQSLSEWPEERRLAVRTRPEEEDIVIEVADNGPGVPEPHREKVFQPFFSLKDQGAGVGLSVARNIISEHEGSISITSRDGCVVTVRLPRCRDANEAIVSPSPEQPDRSARCLRILILDDEGPLALAYSEILKILGCEAVAESEPFRALAVMRERGFDMVFVDYNMPRMNGAEFIRHSSPLCRECRYVLMTGDPSVAEGAFMEQYDVKLLIKPFGLEEMRCLIQETKA